MKRTKRLGSIIIALALLMLSTVSSFAATDADTEKEVLSHVFEAYQIFVGDSIEDEYLTNVEWGSAFTSTRNSSRFLGGLQTDEAFDVNGVNIFEACETAEDVAKVLSNYEDDSDIAKAFATYSAASKYVTYFEEVKHGDEIGEAGYYVFVDTATTGAINPAIVKMAADGIVNIEVKTSVPQMEKKVMENSYDVNYESLTLGTETATDFVGINYGAGYNDVADYSIGDAVPFRLYGTMASTMNDYTSYYYAFVDELSLGLTFTQADADNTTVLLYDYVNGSYKLVDDVTDYFTVTFEENSNNTEITVACDDILAIDGITTTSIIVVDYEATLNEDAVIGYDGNENVAYLEYSNNPNVPDSTGETEKDKVIVFTYKLDVTKTDVDGNTLEGATFYLLNEDGKYYSANGWVANKSDAKLLESGKNGMFVVAGLDEGIYTIVEEDAPKGYKPLEEGIKFEIISDILPDVDDDDAQLWTTTAEDALFDFVAEITYDKENAAEITADENTLTASLEVINTKVYDLPGTGGTGTTLIYIVGGAFILTALALIVFKRRANA